MPFLRTPRGLLLCSLLSSLLAGPAYAAPKHSAVDAEVERLEIAREHFQRGEALAAAGSLEAALVEYELAEVAHPSPSVTEAKQRVRAQLDARTVPPVVGQVPIVEAAPVAPLRPLRRFVAPIVVAPIAIATLVTGAVLLGVTHKDYEHLQGTCSPACVPGDVSPLRARETAGIALLATGGVLAVADVALWAVLARKHDISRMAALRPQLAIGPTGGALTLAGRF